MYCENCGAYIKENSRFCEECGALVDNCENEVRCFVCGASNTIDAAFCEHCGAKLGQSINLPEKKNYKKKNNNKKIIIIVLIFVLLAVAVSIAIFFVKENKKEKEQTIEEIYESDDSDDFIIEQEDLESENLENDAFLDDGEDNTDTQMEEESDYIIDGSDSRYISKSELDGLTKEECRLARNEIYARHGRIFDDEGLREYFNSKSWYYPSIEADDFSESMLNSYEKANCQVIIEYEEERGYR